MSDANDQAVKILIQFIADTQGAEAAAKAMDKLGEASKDSGKKVEEGGKQVASSTGQHRAFRQILGEINRILPGAGHALHLVSEAYIEAGAASETGAVGVTEFNAALSELLVTLGPLIIAMLGIEAVMKYWEMYKDKVKEAADAQDEASKRIQESVKETLKAVQELDAAMHPKTQTIAEHDEEQLKDKEHAIDLAAKRQKEINKANEDKALEKAQTPEDKKKIRDSFETLDKELDDWVEKSKAAVESGMAATMTRQLAIIQEQEQKLIAQSAAEFKERGTPEGKAAYDETQAKLTALGEQAKALREKLDPLNNQAGEDTATAESNVGTHKLVSKISGQKYDEPLVQGFNHDSEIASLQQKLREGQQHYQELARQANAAAEAHKANTGILIDMAKQQMETNRQVHAQLLQIQSGNKF